MMNWSRTLLMITALVTTGCSVFGIRTAEELKYEVLEEQDHFEIRTYAPYIQAEASVDESDGVARRDLFRILAGYIFGKNASQEKITMEKGDNGRWKMGFSMPADYTMDTLPLPLDKRVTLVEVPSKTVAVIRFSGYFGDDKRRSKKTDTLMKWLSENNRYRVVGEPFYAGYDPPFTLPFLRRNEVLIEVQPI